MMKLSLESMSEFQNGKLYRQQRGIPSWKAHLRKLWSVPARFAFGWKFRRQCLRRMGIRMGDSYVGRDCLFDEETPELIVIEDGVTVSSRVTIATHDVWRDIVAPVVLKNHAFVGIGAILLPGVVVGECAVVAAGSVVTKPVEPYTIVAGSPARLLRSLTETERQEHRQR
jgi:acetyltransferase-like isoleucine patch superfamily enzyme